MTLRSFTHEYGVLVTVFIGFPLIAAPWLVPLPWKVLLLPFLVAYLVYAIYGVWLSVKYPRRADLPEWQNRAERGGGT